MKRKIILSILIMFLILTGCGKKEQKPVEKPLSSEPKVVEKPKLKVINENSKNRPYAVMINNINVARKVQSGLQEAYVVYELIVEGGITRMMALYKDADVKRIGTIRSARHYYLDYVLEHDAIYVHIGQSPQAGEDIRSLGVTELKGGAWYYRENPLNLASEHTAYTNTEKMNKEKVSRRETNKPLLLNYSIEEHNYEGEEANKVNIKYSNGTIVNYEYDSENKVYLRSVNNKEHVDYVTKKQYTVKNIIAYAVSNRTMLGAGKGRQELDNIGKGKGVYISNGVTVPITWEKKSRKEQTIYKTEDGKKLIVNDGNTFIQIYPTNGKLTIE